MSYFRNNWDLITHKELCKNNEVGLPIMPTIDDKIKFENYHKKIENPYVIFVGIEAFLNELKNLLRQKNS